MNRLLQGYHKDNLLARNLKNKGDAMETMTPSDKPMTDGQIAKFTDVLKAKLRKAKFPSEPAQVVLEDPEAMNDITDMVVRSFRRLAISVGISVGISTIDDIIICTAYVDSTLSPQEVINTSGCSHQCVSDNVVAYMPSCMSGKKVVYFIPFQKLPDKYKDTSYSISDDNLEKALAELGYKSAEPYCVAAVNKAYPTFSDKYPNGTHWKSGNGKWNFIDFHRNNKGRNIHAYRHDFKWSSYWYFAAEKIEESASQTKKELFEYMKHS